MLVSLKAPSGSVTFVKGNRRRWAWAGIGSVRRKIAVSFWGSGGGCARGFAFVTSDAAEIQYKWHRRLQHRRIGNSLGYHELASSGPSRIPILSTQDRNGANAGRRGCRGQESANFKILIETFNYFMRQCKLLIAGGACFT